MRSRVNTVGLSLALACLYSGLASAQEKPCDADSRVIVSHYKETNGRLQTIIETSGFCNPWQALAAGLAAGFQAEREKLEVAPKPPATSQSIPLASAATVQR